MEFIVKENILYCDLDGVLADFDEGVRAITKKYPKDLDRSYMWAKIRKTPNFYANLPWMPEGKALWESIKIYNPVILTGCPKGGWTEEDKRDWCARELGAHIKVITCNTQDKPDYCNVGDILIDDRDVIKDKWISNGGKYLHYSEGNLLENIKQITDLLYSS